MTVRHNNTKQLFLAGFVLAALCQSALAAGQRADDLKLSCSGNSYKPGDPFPESETVFLKASGKTVTMAIGQGGEESGRVLSNNVYQLKFSAGEFTGQYFHLTGVLFLIYRNGRLIKFACKPE